ncbi:MAG: phosphatase PAP2 family protein [Nitriliruptorales bacterium]|nr:phosphatase PAP2 family protein [Nitriliruptorales bacterium]
MDLIEWGVPVIEWLQARAWLHTPAEVFSTLGDVRFMILWIPPVAWGVDARLGRRLLLAMTAWGAVNSLLKMAFAQPRPYWVSEAVEPIAAESSFGFPSGHAAFAVCVWGALALAVPRRWVRVLAAVMILGIGTSRVVLGVHWPADVIGGWLLGAGVLVIVTWADGGRRPGEHRSPLGAIGPVGDITTMFLGGVLPLALTALVAGLAAPTDPTWLELGGRGSAAILPTSLVGAGALTGGFFGAVVGSAIASERRHPSPAGLSAEDRILRVVVGLAVIVLLAGALGGGIDAGARAATPLAWLLGAATTWWVLDGAPRAFARLRLDGRKPGANSRSTS